MGAVSLAAPMYISEISPVHVRGSLGACNQLAITVGVLLVCCCTVVAVVAVVVVVVVFV